MSRLAIAGSSGPRRRADLVGMAPSSHQTGKESGPSKGAQGARKGDRVAVLISDTITEIRQLIAAGDLTLPAMRSAVTQRTAATALWPQDV